MSDKHLKNAFCIYQLWHKNELNKYHGKIVTNSNNDSREPRLAQLLDIVITMTLLQLFTTLSLDSCDFDSRIRMNNPVKF